MSIRTLSSNRCQKVVFNTDTTLLKRWFSHIINKLHLLQFNYHFLLPLFLSCFSQRSNHIHKMRSWGYLQILLFVDTIYFEYPRGNCHNPCSDLVGANFLKDCGITFKISLHPLVVIININRCLSLILIVIFIFPVNIN